MRRTDREITDPARLAEILRRGQAISLAFAGDMPYVIPMNYGVAVEEGRLTLYIHGAPEGKKIDRMLEDPRVAFTVYVDNRVYGEGDEGSQYTSSFDCVCGEGVARLLQGEEKKRAFAAIMEHYAPGREFTFDKRLVEKTMAAEIAVTAVSGKHHD